MRAFKAFCVAAAFGLVVACAFPQGRGHDSDGGSKGSGSSGGSRSGGSSSGGGHERSGGGGSSSHNSGYQGHGDGGHSNGGGGSSSGGSGSQGHGDGDLGRGGHGGGTTGNGGGSGSGSGGSGGGHNNGGGNGGQGNGGGNSGGTSNGGPTRGSGGDGWFGRGGPTVISGPGAQNGNSGFDLGRKPSRSGSVNYHGSNNVGTVTKVGGSVVIGRAPVTLSNANRGGLIGRKDHPVLIRNGYRTGYYFYTPLWCDDYFWYPFYIFSPWDVQCCISPWYYYPMLPPYVAYDRCRFDHYPAWGVWAGYPYTWNRPAYYGNYDYWGRGHGSAIDFAVDDIVSAFEHQDRRAAGRLISNQDDVAIYVDGKYSYTINAKDFYDMFLDATQNTKTKKYEILSVQTGHNDAGADCVRVTARHEYEDPWGAVTTVDHFYELRYDGPSLIISKFGVSGGNDSH